MKFWVGTRDDGRLVDEDKAYVSVMDHGLTVGDGVFETLKVTHAGPFALSRAITRLGASASALSLAEPEPDIVRIAVEEVMAANAGGFGGLGRLRITYTGGTAAFGSDRGGAVPTLLVGLAAATPWPDAEAVVTVPWTRNPDSATAGVKTTSYAGNVVAFNFAKAQGAGEGILANTRGELCEGTASNVFVVIDGKLLTPPLERLPRRHHARTGHGVVRRQGADDAHRGSEGGGRDLRDLGNSIGAPGGRRRRPHVECPRADLA